MRDAPETAAQRRMSTSPDERQHAVRPLRVLLTTPVTNGRGGVTQYLNAIRPHLQNEVTYFTIGRRSDGEGGATTLLRMIHDSLQFARVLRKGNFDLVHLNPSILAKSLVRDGILLVLAKLQRKRVLVFAHGWNPVWDCNAPTWLRAAFALVYCRADAFMVLGQRFKRKARSLGYRKQVVIAGAPVADELLLDQSQFKRTYAADAKPFNILFLARIERDKGIYEAMDAYRILKREHPSVTLTVAGHGSEFVAAQEYASVQEIRDVCFTGHIEGEERRRAFERASAYVFPSYYEGLPLSVLEAMAMGVPIVATSVGGLPDFFEDGRMGFITESRSPELLASLLSRLALDSGLCDRIRNFNRNYARMHFSARRIAADIERVYRAVSERPY